MEGDAWAGGVHLQGAGGTCVDLSADAARCCKFVTDALEAWDPEEDLEDLPLVPAPGIPDDRLEMVARFLEDFAADAELVAMCEFLEACRRRGDAGAFALGLWLIKPCKIPLFYDNIMVESRIEILAFLDYLQADASLIAAFRLAGTNGGFRERAVCSDAYIRGYDVIHDRFGSARPVTDRTPEEDVAGRRVLVADPRLVPLILKSREANQVVALYLVVSPGDTETLGSPYLRRALAATVGPLKQLGVAVCGSDVANRNIWHLARELDFEDLAVSIMRSPDDSASADEEDVDVDEHVETVRAWLDLLGGRLVPAENRRLTISSTVRDFSALFSALEELEEPTDPPKDPGDSGDPGDSEASVNRWREVLIDIPGSHVKVLERAGVADVSASCRVRIRSRSFVWPCRKQYDVIYGHFSLWRRNVDFPFAETREVVPAAETVGASRITPPFACLEVDS